MAVAAALAFVVVARVASLKIDRTVSGIERNIASAQPTFTSYYNAHQSGRGVWKWNNALDAYQRHFGHFAGKNIAIAEVGVQSGGSLQMWQNVLGKQLHIYGFDINPNCKKFEEPSVNITIGDQADWNMWHQFFTKVPTGLNILVDDGGHEAHQMLTTMQSAFPYVHPGGYISIEDITGEHYLHSFFQPTATFLGKMATESHLVDSVHVYPMVLIVRKGHLTKDSPEATAGGLTFSTQRTVVTDLTAMWTAISTVTPGSVIVLQNPSWGSFLTSTSLSNFFNSFNQLHGVAFKDTPLGCSTTAAPVCTNAVEPMNHLQTRVSGVHIYEDHAVIEVPPKPPRISAVRKGTEWINYAL